MKINKSYKAGVIATLVLAAVAIYAGFFMDWKKGAAKTTPPIRPLKMITVGESRSNPIRRYPGRVSALNRVRLGFQVDGPLIALPVIKGQHVKQGELLAQIDPRDYQNRLDASTAARDQTATQLERIKQASLSGAVSQTDLTNAQAESDRADAILRIAQKALEDTRLLAPFDGVVGDIFVDNFQNVMGKEPVISVQKIEQVLVEVNAPEARILLAQRQAILPRFAALFDSLPGQEFEVTLHEYTTEADPLTQTYMVTFAMPNPKEVNILTGMTATIVEYPAAAELESGPLLVHVDAVPVDVDGTYFVWLLEPRENDTYLARRQNVEVGPMEGDSIQILKGLSKGDKIATSGVHMIQEGQQVRELVSKSAGAKR